MTQLQFTPIFRRHKSAFLRATKTVFSRPEEGRFVQPKYRRKLKLCHLFICVLLYYIILNIYIYIYILLINVDVESTLA